MMLISKPSIRLKEDPTFTLTSNLEDPLVTSKLLLNFLKIAAQRLAIISKSYVVGSKGQTVSPSATRALHSAEFSRADSYKAATSVP